jgi:hypothetical protein
MTFWRTVCFCVSGTPIKSFPLPFPSLPSSKLFKLSFDPAKKSKGLVHKKVPSQKVINHHFRASNIIGEDFWKEYLYGSLGKSL